MYKNGIKKAVVVVVGAVLLAACGAEGGAYGANPNLGDEWSCTNSGGRWLEEFGAIDRCCPSDATTMAAKLTYVPENACNCGINRCWDGTTCVAGTSYQDNDACFMPEAEEMACTQAGGEWTVLSSSCGDVCYAGEDIRCLAVMADGCDCGEGQCWDGYECMDGIGYGDLYIDPLPPGEELCAASGGIWREFSDGCADACGVDENSVCTPAFTMSCDCGEGRCWSGGTCVEDGYFG